MDNKIKQFILKWHWAGKKHAIIIREVQREFNHEISRKDIYDVIFENENRQPK